MKSWRITLAVFFISVVGLAYEITLTRVFSIAQWHNFAYMIISMAMLGFAAAGTFLALVPPEENRRSLLLQLFAGLSVPAIPICFVVSQNIPFETYEITTQPIQLLYLTLLYLVLSLPFFLVSGVITLSLFALPKVGYVYFSNLIGSGLGALLTILSLFYLNPAQLIYCLTIPAFLAFLLLNINSTGEALIATGLGCVGVLIFMVSGVHEVRVSKYKPLRQITRLPGSHVLSRLESPLSVVTAVLSPRIRQSPGQISGMPQNQGQPMPEQIGLYPDGTGPSVVNQADSPVDMSRFSYLNYVTSALPYKLRKPNHTLILGSGGGTSIWKALFHGSRSVTAVEVDPSIHQYLRTELARFSGYLYEKESVFPVHDDARGFLESTQKQYDLIEIPIANSFSASGGGVYSLRENYLFTVEGFKRILSRLSKNGFFVTTQWINSPPRGSLKVISTLLEAARSRGIQDPHDHILALRSWNSVSVVFSKSNFTKTEILKTKTFLKNRSFDPIYYPGIDPADTTNYIETGDYSLHDMVIRLLKEPYSFYEDYLFRVRPSRDNRPYFNHFFKWESLNRIIDQLGSRSLHMVSWGYVVLVITFIQVLPLALLLIVIPFLSGDFRRHFGKDLTLSGAYFFLIGLGFMFLEIAYIQVFRQYLHYPVFSVSVVLTGFLLFSGVGSYLSEQFDVQKNYLVAYLVLLVVSMSYLLGLSEVFSWTVHWNSTRKILMTLGLLMPLSIPLGIPFPTGIRTFTESSDELISFAWATNGASSVLGAVGALILSVEFGFRFVIVTALILYLLAGMVLYLGKR